MFDTDFIGSKVDVGDEVIFVAPGYRSFCIGKVISKATKTCQIEYINDWNFGKPGRKLVVRQGYDQVIVKPNKIIGAEDYCPLAHLVNKRC